MINVTALKHPGSNVRASAKRRETPGYSKAPPAFCGVAHFASSLCDLTRVAMSLAKIGDAFGPDRIVMVRALSHENTRRRPAYTEQGNVAKLGYENAYGPSRAEFRACRRLGMRLKPGAIAHEPELLIGTISSHQPSIYSTTDLSGHVLVVFPLSGARPGDLRVA